MMPILQHRSTESTLSSYIFYVIVVNTLQLYALNGFLLHIYFRHGVFSMNILEVLRAKILSDHPEITEEELLSRLKVAADMLRLNTFRNYR
jgi:hypothetical protein